MGKVTFEDPIHHISGKIAKKFRTIYNYMKATGLKYTSIRGERTTALTAREMQIRTRFIEVAALVNTRAQDLNRVTQDQADFIAQKDLPTGMKTMKAYLWKVCGEEYDQLHG